MCFKQTNALQGISAASYFYEGLHLVSSYTLCFEIYCLK